jgi:restriction system protein
MPEITRRRTGELLRRLFEILLKHPDGLQARTALEELATSIELTAYEAGDYGSGGRRFDKIVRFATVDCVKAGWLVKQKGQWFVTEAGRSALTDYPDPEAFYKEAVRLYHVWKRTQPSDVEGVEEPEAAKETSITYEEAEEMAWREIQAHLLGMGPYEFQDLVAALLRAMGYYVSWVAPPGKDGGVDIIAWSDPLGTRPPRIKAQVKRYTSAVPVGDVRSFMAMLGDEDAGIFVTTSTFTRDAQDEARAQQNRKVSLLDLENLVELWIEYYEKLADSARRRLPLKPIYFLAPEV